MGHYYTWKGRPYRAELCRCCSGRKVTNYKRCLLSGRGTIHISLGCTFYDCITQYDDVGYNELVEITEEQYNQLKLEQMVKEAL